MLVPFLPPPRNLAVDDLLGEIPRDLFTDRLYQACELVERYVSDWAVTIAQRLELEPELARGTTVEAILRSRSLPGERSPALAWLLARLEAAGHLEPAPRPMGLPGADGPAYRLTRALPAPELAELRALGLAIDPAIAPTLAILDAAAEAFPKVLAGALTGEQALFTSARMPLWTDYFHNANPIYALNNRFAAIAAANRLPPKAADGRLPAGGGLRVLEVGAGAGSAAEALLDELKERDRLGEITEYRLTEPNPMLRRRASRALAARYPGLPLSDQSYDIDLAPAEQGLPEAAYDLVFAVNVLHIARDLRASLEWLRSLLLPGGWLVGGECQRLFPGQTIPIELIFEQLASFTDVALDPEVRSAHGFLTPEQWKRAFAATGFTALAEVPDLELIRDHYPRFFSGAICARRPTPGNGPTPKGA